MSVFSRRRRDEELDRELSFHIEQETDRLVAEGMPADEARRRALLAFGGVERFREATLDERRIRALDDVVRDVRHGLRGLVRSPVYTTVSVLTLALGIGSAVAMFTIADGVLLRPLVYGGADRLFALYEATPAGGIRTPSYPAFEDWTADLAAFDAVTFIRGDEFRLRGEDGTQRLLAGYVSQGFFDTVGTQPVVGRVFGDDEADANVVVLSHDLWRRRFAGDRSVIGRTISTADASFTVIGVMPAGFRIPSYADVWTPIRALPADGAYALTQRNLHADSEVWGRIRDDVTVAQARQDLVRVVGNVAPAYSEQAADLSDAQLTPVRERVVGDTAVQLRILIAAVALVLLIACVNVAGLQLARGSTRVREFAVRATLGAGRGRLIRQLLTESLLLSILGGALGVVAALLAVRGLSAAYPAALPRLDEVGLDGRALGFALLATVAAATTFGIMPALQSSSPRLAPSLRGAGAGESGVVLRGRGALVVAQIALAVVLTVGSGLLLRSLWALQRVELGFDSSNVVALRVFPPARYADEVAAATLYRQLQDAVRRVPGVAGVALSNHLPLAGGWMTTRVVTGRPPPEAGELAIIRTVSAEYFDVMRSERLDGRLLEPGDYVGSGSGVVISRALAARFFPDGDAVGRSITVFHSAQGREDFGTPIQTQVVGVIGDERIFDLRGDAPPVVYVPHTWMVWGSITLAARTAVPPATVVPALRAAVQQVEQDIPVAGPGQQAEWRTLDDFIGNTLTQRRLMTGLITAFAAAALGLALLGIFGMTAYLVTRRTREIGIRVAVGAPRRALIRMVLGQALQLALLGITLGLPAAWAGTRLLQSELFGVSGTDPVTVAVTALIFLAAATAAAALPTSRALRISPSDALRSE